MGAAAGRAFPEAKTGAPRFLQCEMLDEKTICARRTLGPAPHSTIDHRATTAAAIVLQHLHTLTRARHALPAQEDAGSWCRLRLDDGTWIDAVLLFGTLLLRGRSDGDGGGLQLVLTLRDFVGKAGEDVAATWGDDFPGEPGWRWRKRELTLRLETHLLRRLRGQGPCFEIAAMSASVGRRALGFLCGRDVEAAACSCRTLRVASTTRAEAMWASLRKVEFPESFFRERHPWPVHDERALYLEARRIHPAPPVPRSFPRGVWVWCWGLGWVLDSKNS